MSIPNYAAAAVVEIVPEDGAMLFPLPGPSLARSRARPWR